VRFYQPELFSEKEYLQESKRVVSNLVAKFAVSLKRRYTFVRAAYLT